MCVFIGGSVMLSRFYHQCVPPATTFTCYSTVTAFPSWSLILNFAPQPILLCSYFRNTKIEYRGTYKHNYVRMDTTGASSQIASQKNVLHLLAYQDTAVDNPSTTYVCITCRKQLDLLTGHKCMHMMGKLRFDRMILVPRYMSKEHPYASCSSNAIYKQPIFGTVEREQNQEF